MTKILDLNGLTQYDTLLKDYINTVILENDQRKHPIGSLEFNVSGTNPNTYLGFGTWELWGSGRVPVGVDTNDTDFNTVEKTGGNKTHYHSFAHTHTVPGIKHTHNYGLYYIGAYRDTVIEGSNYCGLKTYDTSNNGSPTGPGASLGSTASQVNANTAEGTVDKNYSRYEIDANTSYTTPDSATTNSQSTSTTSDGSNTQPYITCYMWKRTA